MWAISSDGNVEYSDVAAEELAAVVVCVMTYKRAWPMSLINNVFVAIKSV